MTRVASGQLAPQRLDRFRRPQRLQDLDHPSQGQARQIPLPGPEAGGEVRDVDETELLLTETARAEMRLADEELDVASDRPEEALEIGVIADVGRVAGFERRAVEAEREDTRSAGVQIPGQPDLLRDAVAFRREMESVREHMAGLVRGGLARGDAARAIVTTDLSWTTAESGLFMTRSIPGFYDEIAAEVR